MKIRYSILSAIFGLAAFQLPANAQQVAIGVRGGLNIPNITNGGGNSTVLSEGYKSRMAWGAGAFAELKFTKTTSLQIGLEYSGQGGKKDGTQAIPSDQVIPGMISGMGGQLNTSLTTLATQLATAGNYAGAAQIGQFGTALAGSIGSMGGVLPDYLYADYNSKAVFNYLMLPVEMKFGWNLGKSSPFRFYVSGGMFVSCLLNAKRISSGSSTMRVSQGGGTLGTAIQEVLNPMAGHIVTDPTASAALGTLLGNVYAGVDQPTDFTGEQNITRDIQQFNYGLIGHLGFSYTFDRNTVFIEGGGQYGFVKLQRSALHGQNRIGAGTVFIGYSYTLGKK